MKITSGRVCRRIFQRVLRALGGVHLQPVAFQHAAEDDARRARVVDDQGSLGHGRACAVAVPIVAPPAVVITDNRGAAALEEYARSATAHAGGWLPWRTRPQISATLRWLGRRAPARRCWPRACSPSPARSAAAAASSAARRCATSTRRNRQLRHSLDAAIVHFDVGGCRVNLHRYAGLSRLRRPRADACSKRWKPPRSSSAPSTASSPSRSG